MVDPISLALSPVAGWGFERRVKVPIERAFAFEGTCDRAAALVAGIEPALRRIEEINKELDNPLSETSEFLEILNQIKPILEKRSKANKVKRLYQGFQYSSKLESLLQSKDDHMTLLATHTARDSAEILNLLRQIYDDFGKLYSELFVAGAGDFGRDTVMFGGRCGAPNPPEFTVGLGPALEALKRMILEEKGCDVLVLTAPPGCGKTTLAHMLCHDQNIKGRFNANIMFVTVSETPNLRLILEDLSLRNGIKVPTLQGNKDPSGKLINVLDKIGESPLLLVLDDVWPGSADLIDKFINRKIKEYKILVTSRSEFPRFKHSYKLERLNDEDSFTLFCHHANLGDADSNIPDEIMKQVASHCKNNPLALKLIGTSLRGHSQEIWESISEEWSTSDSSVLESETVLLDVLRRSLELLPQKEKLKECFTDLCSFREDQRITATVLFDVWKELHRLTEKAAAANLYHLYNRNLAHLVITRSDAEEKDGDYSEHFLIPHDLLRKLAIHESNKEGSETKRLIVHLRGNDLGNQKPLDARLVSITTDGPLSSEWHDIQLPEAEVLILNIQAEDFKIPEFVKSMAKLKLLIVTNQSYFKAKLINFELLDSLTDLKIIRLEGIGIASLCEIPKQLKNLHKLTLVMCKIGQAFSSGALSELLKNLMELNFHYCDDLTTLPSGLKKLKKLRVTHCHKLSSLPQDIGEMENLEELNLRYCIDMEKLPESICELPKLNFLDMSDCFSLRDLPEKIGDLGSLTRLNIKGCSRLKYFPESILELEESLKDVACDEDMKELLELHLSSMAKMKARVPKEYINLNWL